ncbi:MAG: HD domain-containing phosphohydrolase [Bdellovibrionales bacterium]
MQNVDYFSVRTFSFPYIQGFLKFDVFHKDTTQKYKKIFAAGQLVDPELLASHILKGVSQFYVLKSARNQFLSSSLSVIQNLRGTPEIANESSQEIIDEIAEQTLSEIFVTKKFNDQTQVFVRGIVDTYISLAESQPVVLPHLIKLARKKEELVKHMVMTSIFSTLLARAFDPKDHELILAAGYAGFVHDIGLSQMDVSCDEHTINMFTTQNAELRTHSSVGAKLLIMNKGIPDQVIAGVVQHHEAFDGTGYPNRMRGNSISLAGRIISLTGYFTAMTCGSKFATQETPTAVIQKMARSGKFDPKLIELFSNLFKLNGPQAPKKETRL